MGKHCTLKLHSQPVVQYPALNPLCGFFFFTFPLTLAAATYILILRTYYYPVKFYAFIFRPFDFQIP